LADRSTAPNGAARDEKIGRAVRFDLRYLGHTGIIASPAIQVEPDLIFIRDGRIYTSGGVTAGIDLAMAMVEEGHGRDIALLVARRMLMFLRRHGKVDLPFAQIESGF
jgi:hypothetical protein